MQSLDLPDRSRQTDDPADYNQRRTTEFRVTHRVSKGHQGCDYVSAWASARTAFNVSNSESPGPAPIRNTLPSLMSFRWEVK